jgi:hypothetical protein
MEREFRKGIETPRRIKIRGPKQQVATNREDRRAVPRRKTPPFSSLSVVFSRGGSCGLIRLSP